MMRSTFFFRIISILFLCANSHPLEKSDKNDIFCTMCTDAVKLAERVFDSDIIKECLVEFIQFMCDVLKIEDHKICKGIIADFKDEFLYILNELLKEPSDVCGLFDANCDKSGINPLNFNWSIPIPQNKPPHIQRYPPKKGMDKDLKILHISDIHVDLNYAVGSEVECPEPMCCRMPKSGQDLNSGIKKAAGYWGSVGNCDVPIWTLESMLKYASKEHDRIDYIVISGDLESHTVWDYNKDEHQKTIKAIFSLFNQYFNSTPLFFSLGNHEGVPIDNIAPHFVPARFKMDWLYETLDESFGKWLTDDQRKALKYNGCYMVKVADKLRLLSLNNVLGDPNNFWLYLNQTDPDGSMTWLSNQLLDAEKAKDKVQILAHIPGGSDEAFQSWSINYYNLVNRFEDTIVGQFFGHTHSELLYLTFEDPNNSSSRPTSTIYSAPSLTTYTDFNPAYRIYTIDGERKGTTYKVIDWEEHYLDLETANEQPNHENAPWTMMYGSAKSQYQISYLEPENWYDLSKRFLKGDITLQRYVGNRNRRFNTFCDHDCAKDVVCDIYTAQQDHSELCRHLRIEKSEKWSETKLEKIRESVESAKLKYRRGGKNKSCSLL